MLTRPFTPFAPTSTPIDPAGTAVLIDQLDTWFTDGGTTDDALAILDKLATTAGEAFADELTVYLARAGLASMGERQRAAA